MHATCANLDIRLKLFNSWQALYRSHGPTHRLAAQHVVPGVDELVAYVGGNLGVKQGVKSGVNTDTVQRMTSQMHTLKAVSDVEPSTETCRLQARSTAAVRQL